MASFIKKVSGKTGLPPGQLTYVGSRHGAKARISIFDYNRNSLREDKDAGLEKTLRLAMNPDHVTWINVDGLDDVGVLGRLGEHFNIDPLVMEDVLNTAHRPKFENYGSYIHITLKMLTAADDGDVDSEQVTLILTADSVISFQEREGDVFETIRERIRGSKGRIREMDADYLAYALIDAIVDHYFVVLEKIDEEVEAMEELISSQEDGGLVERIHQLKRTILFFRKSIWPVRDLVGGLLKDDSSLIHDGTKPYLRDLHDHVVQVADIADSMRDLASSVKDTYLTEVGNRMNEIMKTLTIIATIFIPMTFVAGIYGMNFELMPELKWRYGYLLVWGMMLGIAICMIIYFRRKKWI